MYTGRAIVTFEDGRVLNLYVKTLSMGQPFDGPMELTVTCVVLPDDLKVRELYT